jgi:hypothetical protein
VTMVLTTTSRELLERLDVSVRELAHGHLFERTRGHSEAPA